MSDFDTWYQTLNLQDASHRKYELMEAAFAAGRASVEAAPSQEPVAVVADLNSRTQREVLLAQGARAGDYLYLHPSDAAAQIAELTDERDWYKKRCDLLQENQHTMRDPERTIVCDILANGKLLEPAGDRYTAPSQEPVDPFAWATFDGEGSYDLRLYELNEDYADKYRARNGKAYHNWVFPLYTHPSDAAAQIAKLEAAAR